MITALFCIFIILQISDNDTVFFDLDSVYRRYEIVFPDTGVYDSFFLHAVVDSQTPGSEQLRITGSKDFLFDIDQGFNQGLNVDITGEVEGVSLEGSLSDKSTPSSTMRLSEVERIRLLASTRHFSGGIGDLELNLPFGIQDEIQGVHIRAHSIEKTQMLGAAYAINRGTIKRMRFGGEEGKQSPYMLDGPVVPGSEHVYVAHGISTPILMQRDKDYTIDYEQGILSFTNAQLITNRTRIEVEYKLLDDDYPTIYAASDGQGGINNAMFSGLVRRSYDDRYDPISFTLSQDEMDTLAMTGDSALVAHTYADTSSDGDYIFDTDHFVYVGAGLGTHLVTFFYTGEGNGDYIYDPVIKAFAYTGPNTGNYSPTKLVPLPEQEIFYGITGRFFETARIDVYGSQYDKNLFSSIDDDDNYGLGFNIMIDRQINIFTINGQYITFCENFHKPYYSYEIDLPYQWNTTDSLREMGIGHLGVAPWSFLVANMSYGVLNREHYRKAFSIHPFFLSFGYEGIDTLNKYYAGLDHTLGKVVFASHYEYTRSSHFVDYAIAYMYTERSRAGLRGSYDEDTLNKGITTIAEITTVPFTLSVGHRRFNDTTFIFGNARINISYKDFSVLGTVEQSQRYLQKRDETYVRVEDGTGNYVYDPVTQTYVERDYGDFVRKVFLLDDFERVVSRKYNAEARYIPSFLELSGRLGYVDEEDFFRIDGDVVLLLGQGERMVELNVRQDFTEDSRYSLYTVFNRTRQISIMPVFNRLSGTLRIKEHIDRLDAQIREQRYDYLGELAYRILEQPLIKPLAGYTYSTIVTDYFSNLNINLNTMRSRLLFGMPILKKGRIEVAGELLYRLYNIEGIPYFFTAREPEGLTKRIQASASLGVGASTVFSLNYSIEFPPDEDFRQNLRFQTKIRF